MVVVGTAESSDVIREICGSRPNSSDNNLNHTDIETAVFARRVSVRFSSSKGKKG